MGFVAVKGTKKKKGMGQRGGGQCRVSGVAKAKATPKPNLSNRSTQAESHRSVPRWSDNRRRRRKRGMCHRRGANKFVEENHGVQSAVLGKLFLIEEKGYCVRRKKTASDHERFWRKGD